MHTELLVGPVMNGAEGQDVWVLHAAERSLHVRLAPVGAYDLLVCPCIAVGEEQRFSEQGPVQVVPVLLTEGPLERRKPLCVEVHGGREQVLHMAPCEDGADALAGACEGGLTSCGAPVGVTFERCLQGLELAPPF